MEVVILIYESHSSRHANMKYYSKFKLRFSRKFVAVPSLRYASVGHYHLKINKEDHQWKVHNFDLPARDCHIARFR